MKISKIFKILICMILLAIPIITNANDLNDGNGDVDDTTAAPISDYAPLLLIAGLATGCRFLKKRSII